MTFWENIALAFKGGGGSLRPPLGRSYIGTYGGAALSGDAPFSYEGRVREAYAEVFHAMRLDGQVTDPLFLGAREAIDAVERAGWLLGLATGKSHRGLIATLERHDLVERFVTLQTADRAAGKPNPEMLLNAMAETGAPSASTVMIGDTTYDMEMARNAGTLAIGVAWGYHEADELRDAGAHVVIGAFSELPSALHGLMEKVA